MKKLIDYYTIDHIRALFRDLLRLPIGRAQVYYYIQKHSFPTHTGVGHPRRWNKKTVDDWFKKQTAKF